MFKGIIRPIKKEDVKSVEKIFDLYWNDDFRNHLSNKLKKYFEDDSDLISQKFNFFIAEESREVVGVGAIRILPEHLRIYSKTNNPAELYVIAVKIEGQGIGSELILKNIEEAKKEGYTEILLFSGEKHNDSWKFHDKFFKRIDSTLAPNGESGYVWGKLI